MHQRSKIYFVIKHYMFRASSVPIIRSYLLYARQLVHFMRVMWPLPRRVRLDIWCILYVTCHDSRSLEHKVFQFVTETNNLVSFYWIMTSGSLVLYYQYFEEKYAFTVRVSDCIISHWNICNHYEMIVWQSHYLKTDM